MVTDRCLNEVKSAGAPASTPIQDTTIISRFRALVQYANGMVLLTGLDGPCDWIYITFIMGARKGARERGAQLASAD